MWGVFAAAFAAAVTRSSWVETGVDLSWITDAIFG